MGLLCLESWIWILGDGGRKKLNPLFIINFFVEFLAYYFFFDCFAEMFFFISFFVFGFGLSR